MNAVSIFRSLLTLAVAGSCFVLPRAEARPAIDTVVMKNGDRLTCELKRLDGGVLSVSLDYVDGLVSIQWSQVARLESTQLFIVQTQDGSIYTGKLSTPEIGPGRPLKLEVVSDVEPVEVIAGEDVVELNQTAKLFLQRLSGSLSAGSTYTKGNNATQYNFSTDLAYRRARWGVEISYQSNLSATNGADTTTRNQLDFRGNHMLPRQRNTFFFEEVNLLQSSVQGIARQTSAGGGIGRFIKNTNQITLSVAAGVVGQNASYEKANVQQPDQQVGAGLISLDFRAFKFKRTNLVIKVAMLPAFTERRTYYRANATYYLKLFSNLTWNLSYYGSWDTNPPAQFSGSDYGASIGVGWKFHR